MNVKVSIICLAYNHKRYIKDALNSFLMQKTNFDYEIIIHDDASNDGTTQIIKEYEEKYPDIVKPIYQKENQYSKGINIFKEYLFPKVKSEYVALCEGDDFWIDEYKLQKQYDALKNNPNCYICVHNVLLCKENGTDLDIHIPDKRLGMNNTGLLNNNNVLDLLLSYRKHKRYPFQTSSYFFNLKILMEGVAYGEIKMDMDLLLYYTSKGDFYYINDVMSKYRIGTTYSVTKKYDEDGVKTACNYELYFIEKFINYDKYTKGINHKLVYKKVYTRLAFMPKFTEKVKKYMKDNSINLKSFIKNGGIGITIVYISNRYLNFIYRKVIRIIFGKEF